MNLNYLSVTHHEYSFHLMWVDKWELWLFALKNWEWLRYLNRVVLLFIWVFGQSIVNATLVVVTPRFGDTVTNDEVMNFRCCLDGLNWFYFTYEVLLAWTNVYKIWGLKTYFSFISCDVSPDEFASLYRGWTVFRTDHKCILLMYVGQPRDALVRSYHWSEAHSCNDWTFVNDSL